MTVRAATIVVSNTNDSGSGSLRDAINQANAGGATVVFSIPGGGVHRIAPTSPMPAVNLPTIFDATTQPGYAGAPLIEVYGGNEGGNGATFVVNGGGTTIKGFIFDGWYSGAGAGIILVSSGNKYRSASGAGRAESASR